MKRAALLLAVLAVVLLLPVVAMAQAAQGDSGAIIAAVRAVTATWAGPLTTISSDLFGALILVSFVMSIGFAYAQGEGLAMYLAIAIRFVVFAGAWLFVLQNWASGFNFGSAIIRSFQTAATNAGVVPSSPADVIGYGVSLGEKIIAQSKWLEPGRDLWLMIAAIIVGACFFIAAAVMVFTLAKAYIVIAQGALAMGFAGSEFTGHIARGVVFQSIGAGARLFAVEMMTSMLSTIVQRWLGESTALDQTGDWTVLGLAVVYVVLVFSIPSAVEHAFGGSGSGRAGPGELIKTGSTTLSLAMGTGLIGGGGSGGGAALPGGARLALPAPSSGGGAAAASAGMSMRPRP
jgi:P-type conjugative transfer protein TrbL